MSWLARRFRPHIDLPAGYANRVEKWRGLRDCSEQETLVQARFMVVDVETSGLDTRKDRLLSIGACALQCLRLHTGENYGTVLHRDEPSERDNVLIHGIGPQEQAMGQAPEESLMGFLEFVGKQPLAAFHAGFDQAVLDRELRRTLGLRLPSAWIDLALLAPALVPEARLPRAGLEEWLAYFNLRVHTRHRALDDALATGELFLILLKRALTSGLDSVGSLLVAAEEQQRKGLGGNAGGA